MVQPEAESEGELLARAQAELGRSPAAALSLTDRHRANFPKASMGQEREVIAITALVAMGRTAEAKSRAEQLLARDPRSAHRRRLMVLLPGLSEGAPSP